MESSSSGSDDEESNTGDQDEGSSSGLVLKTPHGNRATTNIFTPVLPVALDGTINSDRNAT